jgi:hypothetical protein
MKKLLKIEIGKEQKGLLQSRNLKIENRIIKTDCTLLDIFIYLCAMIVVLISTYGLIKLNVQLLFMVLTVSLLGLYFLIRKNEKIMI